MAMSTYPDYRAQMLDMVNDHHELAEEPLLLAVYYAPDCRSRLILPFPGKFLITDIIMRYDKQT